MAEEKLKILYLMQVLLEETDKAHPMNATQLCDRMMKDHGYSYNRKTSIAKERSVISYYLCRSEKTFHLRNQNQPY